MSSLTLGNQACGDVGSPDGWVVADDFVQAQLDGRRAINAAMADFFGLDV
jgi:hypothetical protein